MRVYYGTTRVTFLIGAYAIKVAYSPIYVNFLFGLIANLQERMWYKQTRHVKLCPNYVCLFWGLILISARAKTLSSLYNSGVEVDFDFDAWATNEDGGINFGGGLVENKLDSFGYYQNRIVAVDYH